MNNARFDLTKRGKKGGKGKQRLLSFEFALEKQGKTKADYFSSRINNPAIFIAFGSGRT